MTTNQHIDKLEKDINGVKTDIHDVKVQLSQLITLVQEMNRGLYGDEKNDNEGVIERQKEITKEIEQIKKEVLEIHKKNVEQDIALHARKSMKDDLIGWGKNLIGWIIQIIVIIAILKGLVDADALLKL